MGTGRDGALRLTFARRDGRPELVENYSRPPLQVMRAIHDAAGVACVYLLSPTGGVVQSDRYDVQIRVEAGVHALITTQSATKIYRMPDDCAEQTIRIEVERDSILEFVPDAAILFADADFRQDIEVTLHPGALLFLHEVVLPGRVARGEHLTFRRYANRIVVRDGDGLILYDAADIDPTCADLSATGRLEGYACWGSAYLVGDLAARGIDAAAFCQTHRGLLTRDDSLGEVSPLYRNGLSARMVSRRLESIYGAFHDLRGIFRTQSLGLRDAPLRK
jgi:urease accessory protein